MYPVFTKALRDSRRTIISLSIGFALYALFVMAFYPAIIEEQESFEELMQSYPEEMLAFMTGGQDVSEFSITDPFVSVAKSTVVSKCPRPGPPR
jgi:hypothetical protein